MAASAEAEAEFMASLLADLDDQFWNAVPTPDPSPRKPRPSTPKPEFSATDLTELLEGAEDWDWDDMNSDAMSPSLPRYNAETCTRCVVESVLHSDPYLKTLSVKVASTSERRTVHLRDDWTTTPVRPGDTINVLGPFSPSITITAKAHLLILHPDLLITATALSNAPQCRRKPLLSALVRSSSETTPALVWGHMLHEVMQACLREGRWEKPWIDARIRHAVHAGLEQLVKIDATVEQAVKELEMRAKGLVAFADKYVSSLPKPNAILTNTRTTRAQGDSLLAITELLDVEEDIWSPTYGLKGKLDATIHATIFDPTPSGQNTLTSGPRPLEIKTGRAIAGMEHRAQTMLYTLLAQERYAVPVEDGLLYYTQSEEVVRVPRGRNEVRGLVLARNEMAAYIVRRSGERDGEEARFLPPTIDDERMCGRCYALDTCMLYRRAVENVVDATSPIASVYALKTGHLTDPQAAFFKKWEAMIALEEQDLVRFKKELWTMGARERERKGRCFADMVLDGAGSSSSSSVGGEGIHRFTYRFVRRTETHASLLSGYINPGDAVTVSVDPRLLALARGFVLDLSPTAVVVGVDHEVSVAGIMKRLGVVGKEEVVFRIDRDELFAGMGRIRDNLAQMFYVEGDRRRLELVVDLRRPVFDELPASSGGEDEGGLNPNQVQALDKVLAARDYALILGMPGTGKTTVVAEVIRRLVGAGKTVLLTSYTHSAVDTILMKLVSDRKWREEEFGILRLGNVDKVHPDVRRFTLVHQEKARTIEELETRLMGPPVVATTCLSVDHALFERRKFDYCIVDEASQITLPTCLGPLRYAERFVLVGDHFQLPPLVRNPAARKAGLDVSLFRRLSDAHPHAVVELAWQYRMNEEIMAVSNGLIYGGRLRCGSEEVARRGLRLGDGGAWVRRSLHGQSQENKCGGGCWIERVLDESCKVVFVDTDALPARDSRVGDLVQNEVEAELVCQIAGALVRSGVEEGQIGVLSLYRQQVKLLGHLLNGAERKRGIEVLTADKSQGRDKDCVIISMVRSNDTGNIGDLVKDWRRMNVSFTRARSKLVVVGSRGTLQGAVVLAEFFELMQGRGWIMQLPEGAHLLHPSVASRLHAGISRGAGSVVSGSLPVGKTTPGKRVLKERGEGDPEGEEEDENVVGGSGGRRPVKKVKVDVAGLVRGRPILKDLVNEDMDVV